MLKRILTNQNTVKQAAALASDNITFTFNSRRKSSQGTRISLTSTQAPDDDVAAELGTLRLGGGLFVAPRAPCGGPVSLLLPACS